MLLGIPASINKLDEPFNISLLPVNEIWLNSFSQGKPPVLLPQKSAYFSIEQNKLLVCSLGTNLSSRVRLTDCFYLLLDDSETYSGFFLEEAMNHISSESEVFDDRKFGGCLAKMLFFCRQEIYDAMDRQEPKFLSLLNELEQECLHIQNSDGRTGNVLEFVKNAKFTFYDVEH